MKKKIVAAALACVLCVGLGIGGTLAWLVDDTDPVVNTFTTSNIDITLAETDTKADTDDNVATNAYKMIPGYTIAKDPKVTVVKDSEACWLFVKIVESTDVKFSDYMTYEIADGWTALDGVAGVYCRKVAASTADQAFDVLKDNQVVVKDGVTKEMMKAAEGKEPTLTFTAYASQLMQNATTEFSAADAWANLANPTATPNA